jgi:hypothetical protein
MTDMKKRTLISLLGLWIALVPFLGIPSSWRSRIIIITGLGIAALAFSRRKSVLSTSPAQVSTPTLAPAQPKISPAPAAAVSHVAPVKVSEPKSKPEPKVEPKPEPKAEIKTPATDVQTAPKKPRKPRTIKLAVSNTTVSDALPETAPEELSVYTSSIKTSQVSTKTKALKV